MKREVWITSEDFEYRIDLHDSIKVPEGSFIVPMDERWVPKDVKERLERPTAHSIYAYTKYGIIVVPKRL